MNMTNFLLLTKENLAQKDQSLLSWIGQLKQCSMLYNRITILKINHRIKIKSELNDSLAYLLRHYFNNLNYSQGATLQMLYFSEDCLERKN